MSPQLGNFLEGDLLNSASESRLCIRSVIKVFCPLSNEDKRFVIVGTLFDGTQVLLARLNRHINKNIFNTAELQDQFISLDDEGRPYIRQESFVNCKDVLPYAKETLIDILNRNPDAYLGDVSEVDYKKIRNKICDSRFIKPGVKKIFGVFIK